MVRLSFCEFCCEEYMGAFTEVPCFEETKVVAPCTGAPYGGIVPVRDRTGAYLDQLRDPFDLVKLETRELSFNALMLHPLCP